MIRNTIRFGFWAGLTIALTAGAVAPVLAQEAPPKKHHHHSGVGAAIGAGVLGGIVGGAILGNQGQGQPAYEAPPPVYASPPPRAYDADADGYDEPVCHLVRKPVYDEDGQVVDYRTRRVCQ